MINSVSEMELRLPRRHIYEGNIIPKTDNLGFLAEEEIQNGNVKNLNSLFEYWCTIILAPPWTGKTFLSKEIYNFFQTDVRKEETNIKFLKIERTSFEDGLHDFGVPTWWQGWKEDNYRACWIIDALDEGHHRYPGVQNRLLSFLKDLNENQRTRLNLLIFSRPGDFLENFQKEITELDNQNTQLILGNSVQIVNLAPLTHEEAKEIIQCKQGDFESVQNAIKNSSLQSISGLPIVTPDEEIRRFRNTHRHRPVRGSLFLARGQRGC